MNIEKIYTRLPETAQRAAAVAMGWRVGRRRYPAHFVELLEEYRSRAMWPADRLAEFGRRRAEAILAAARNVPAYRRLWAEAGVDPDEVRTVDQLDRLPSIDKNFVREAGQAMCNPGALGSEELWLRTSGSTGAGLPVRQTVEFDRRQWAVWWRYRTWHGVEFGDRHGNFGGKPMVPAERDRPPFWRSNPFMKQVYFSNAHMRPPHLDAYCDEIDRRRLKFLGGYPSLLTLLAEHMVRGGRRLPSVRAVFFGAENVLDHQRELITRAFGFPPRSHYGLVEGVANISECPEGRFHVDEDFAWVEFLPIEGSEGLYRIVGTTLWNEAMPLVRYDTGDVAAIDADPQPCPCGRSGRQVRRIDGRQEDLIVRRDGTRVACFNQVLKHATHIREAQILQRRPGAITMRYVPLDGFPPEQLDRLREGFRARLGADMEIDFERVDAVPRTRTGKIRFVVSELEQGRIDRTGAPAPG
jgi:phenylacetate-CoA ligase